MNNRIFLSDFRCGVISDWSELPFLEILGIAGADYFIFDTEHRIAQADAMERILVTCKSIHLPVAFRIPEYDIHSIGRLLDMGCDAIVLPHVNDIGYLKRAIDEIYFPPKGHRGIGQSRSNAYTIGKTTKQYVDEVNNSFFLLPQIEDDEGCKIAKEILQTDATLGLLLGLRDLSTSLGVPGDFMCDAVQSRIERLRDLCAAAGKPLIIPCSVESIEYYKNKGINSILLSANPLLNRALKQAFELIKA